MNVKKVHVSSYNKLKQDFLNLRPELYLLSGENKIKLVWPHPFQEEDKHAIYMLDPVINDIVSLYQG